MGSESKNNGDGGGGGMTQIPAASKKVVQNIREIVNKNCTDNEIYTVLCECNLDADAAVQKLLSQDTFHQVKSKRERRKEMKETQEAKAQDNSSGYRGVKIVGEYNVGRVPSQTSYNDLGKAAYRKEDGFTAPSGSSSAILVYRVKTPYERSASHSDHYNAEDRRQGEGTSDPISSAQLSAGTQAAWSGGGSAGHISMADIVRMGRPHNKGSQNVIETSYTPQDADSLNSSHNCSEHPLDSLPSPPEMYQVLQCPHHSQVSENNQEYSVTASQHGFHDSVIEQQIAVSRSSILNVSKAFSTEMFSNQSYFYGDGTKLTEDCRLEGNQVSEKDAANKSPSSNGGSHCGDGLLKDMTCDSWRCMNELHEGIRSGSHLPSPNGATLLNDEASSAAVKLQQLSLGKEPIVPPSQDNHAVVFPDYMRALAADCSHLSFGTYKSGLHNAVSGPLASTSLKNNSEEGSAATNGSSALSIDSRNFEHLGENLCNEELGSMSDAHQSTAGVGHHEMPVSSQPDPMRQNIPEVSQGLEYMHPSSVPDSSFKKTQELVIPLDAKIHPKARNLPPFHAELQANSTTVPVDVLASSIQSSRDSDYAQSSFLGTQSMLSRFSNAASSTSKLVYFHSEIQNSSPFSSLPLTYSLTVPVPGLALRTLLPQQLSANLYSQPAVPLEELANLNGYHAMPQNYARNPSAFEQAHQDYSAFHDSLTGMGFSHPEYKTGTVSNLLNISGYGGFGGTSNFPGGTLQGTTPTGYNALHSRYQDRHNFTALKQNDGSSSRMMSAFQDNKYFSLPGQSQLQYPLSQQLPQDFGDRFNSNACQHGQQLSRDYGCPLHGNAYYSQAGIPREQQRQTPNDMTFNNSQGQLPKELLQLWQHSY